MKRQKYNSDYTTIYKDEDGTHILKCKILDSDTFLLQFYNKTKDVLLPCIRVTAGYWDIFKQKKLYHTKELNRSLLVECFKTFKFNYLVTKLHNG